MMSKTKWIVVASVAGMLLTSSAGVYAGAKMEKISAFKNYGISIELDGKAYTPVNSNGDKMTAITYEGTTYLPIRAVGETLNSKVLFDVMNNKIMIQSASGVTTSSSKAADSSSSQPTAKSGSTGKSTTGTSSSTPSTADAASAPAAYSTPAASSKPSAASQYIAAANEAAKITAGNVTNGPIGPVVEEAAAPPVVSMTTGIITSKYLPTDFPFPADAVKGKVSEQIAGDKKQLFLTYTTQASLKDVGNAYLAYYAPHKLTLFNNQVDDTGLSIAGTLDDKFGVAIQGNPMSLKPGYNAVVVTLAEQ
ncbi:hypothetical protein [Paenibacillus bovis]|uniref:Copper amine oxidase-like N-terminal domain-containing protein n=1 Tax=Paenibacillus bovis TaxID=1616788 RepID=A0A172ZAP4_9BACL|nr:hypothetical protein [Paenibacillus bovis]ANF94704.1 hypothetical protein AR543_00760 [Paenibacillus bovis]